MAKLKKNGHEIVKVGTKVMYRGEWGYGPLEQVTIERIELCECEGCKYGDEVSEVSADDLYRCCVDLDNEHWAYGYQIEEIIG